MQYLLLFKEILLRTKEEIGIILISILFGYLLSSLLKRRTSLFNRPVVACLSSKNEEFCITHNVINFFIILIFLIFGIFASEIFLNSSNIIIFVTKISFLKFLIEISKTIINHHPARKIVIVMILAPITLKLFNIFDKTINYIDNLGFNINNFNLSIFFIIKSIYIGIFLAWIGKLLSRFFDNTIRKQIDWSSNTREILVKLSNIILSAILFVTGLNILGINLTALTIFSGALGVGIGLSLQKISSNFLSGLILLFEKTVSVGDIIECQNGVKGRITYLGARTTIIEDYDGGEVILPNDDLINSKIINWLKEERNVKIVINIKVSNDNDPTLVKKLLIKSVNNENLNNITKIDCNIINFIENDLEYRLEFSSKTNNKLLLKTTAIENIWKLLKENNIRFNYK